KTLTRSLHPQTQQQTPTSLSPNKSNLQSQSPFLKSQQPPLNLPIHFTLRDTNWLHKPHHHSNISSHRMIPTCTTKSQPSLTSWKSVPNRFHNNNRDFNCMRPSCRRPYHALADSFPSYTFTFLRPYDMTSRET
ncbi:hypothetical protein KC19_9G100700, partial [Ceratodon purpureus]